MLVNGNAPAKEHFSFYSKRFGSRHYRFYRITRGTKAKQPKTFSPLPTFYDILTFMIMSWTEADKEAIQKYYGEPLEQLRPEAFHKVRKKLLAKYHPDNFEKFEDETIREMATERFQAIEKLNQKIELYFEGKLKSAGDQRPAFHPDAQYAFDKLKIEIFTSDKDLKYHLFGTFYRWLVYGDKFKIPDTQASIIIDEDHQGTSIGYRETIRMYLSFDTSDPIDRITRWLFDKIEGRASSLLIHGEVVTIEYEAMLRAIKQTTFLQIGPGPA